MGALRLIAILAVLQATPMGDYNGEIADIKLVPDGASTAVVVHIHKDQAPLKADQVVVQTFYRKSVAIDGKDVRLLLSRTSVVPAFVDTWLGTDDVPSDDVDHVTVTLVRNVEQERIQFRAAP